MASQALYRKWRSQTFAEVIGQQHVTQTLINALDLGRVAHAYLFSGPRGTGKTTTARLLAKAVNCRAEDQTQRPCNECHICTAINEGRLLDLIEIDAASNTGVDDIRDLRDKVGFRPSEARIKFYIIDEVHMLSNSAFNALLKTLEEPPEHVIFVLATTEPEKIPATITSRCQRFDFKRIKLEEVAQWLGYIAEQEDVEVDQPALNYIARQGGGSMRDAISLLDQLIAYGSGKIDLELVQTVLGAVTSESVIALVEALIERNTAQGLDVINQVINDGVDPRQMAREIVDYLRGVMLVKLGDGPQLLNVPAETLAMMQQQAGKAEAAMIVRATNLFNSAMLDIKSGLLSVPQLPLELAFVEGATVANVTPPLPQAAPPPVIPSPPERLQTAKSSPSSTTRATPEIPATTQVTVPSAGGELTIDTIRSCFEKVLLDLEMKNKVMAETLRTQTRLYKVSGNQVYFVTNEMMKQRFEKPQPQTALNDAFSRAVAQPISVHFVTEQAATAGGQAGSDEKQAQENAEALLKVAEELGGEIVEE